MKMNPETEGVIRFTLLAPPPVRAVAEEIISIAIMYQSSKRIFAPEAKRIAVDAMRDEWGADDQITAASDALTEHSLPMETYCSERFA